MYHTRYSLQSQRCFYTYPNIVIKMMNFDELIDFKISGVGWSELASIQKQFYSDHGNWIESSSNINTKINYFWRMNIFPFPMKRIRPVQL